MDIVDPCIDPALVPEGSRPKVFNGPEKEYRELPAIVTPNGHVITRWHLTDAERRQVLAGEDVYITIQTFPHEGPIGIPARPIVINPLFATIGPVDWSMQEGTPNADD